jgi:hypothetical protein
MASSSNTISDLEYREVLTMASKEVLINIVIEKSRRINTR